ncbi:hypothetical protein ACL02U_06495 [Streptomyces sp. MS06]|uniref:SCO2102 family sporulation regulator n=1 Tax=Streptomyces sp. MS06 TaxID=3385974 RepID=UPI0039A1926E
MSWTAVLYIAFGGVALWLLGEVLLQYKARLRWRLLAFTGFLGVVLGVLIASVVVIGLGAAAFAVGQTYVTLSFRRGFAAGWAVSRRGAEDGPRRRGTPEHDDEEQAPYQPGTDDPEQEYADQAAAPGAHTADGDSYDQADDHDDVFTPVRPAGPSAAETTAVYEPEPMPEDTGSYGVYGDTGYAAAQPQDQYAAAAQPQDQYAAAAHSTDQNYGYDGYTGYGQYGYDASGQQQYAAYSDPYIGSQGYGSGYEGTYDGGYGQQAYGQEQYTGGYAETPAEGVWVPQQRATDGDPYAGGYPQEQQYPYQQGDGTQGDGTQGGGTQGGAGYDEQQYRF